MSVPHVRQQGTLLLHLCRHGVILSASRRKGGPYELWEEAPGGLTVRPEGHWILSGHLSFLKARGAGQSTFLGNCDWTEQGHLW